MLWYGHHCSKVSAVKLCTTIRPYCSNIVLACTVHVSLSLIPCTYMYMYDTVRTYIRLFFSSLLLHHTVHVYTVEVKKKSTFHLRTVFITVCVFITVAITIMRVLPFLLPFAFSLPLQLPCACIMRLRFPLSFTGYTFM